MDKEGVGQVLGSCRGLLGGQRGLANNSGNVIEPAKSNDGGWETAFERENAVGLSGLGNKINNIVEEALEGLGIGNSKRGRAECVTGTTIALLDMSVVLIPSLRCNSGLAGEEVLE